MVTNDLIIINTHSTHFGDDHFTEIFLFVLRRRGRRGVKKKARDWAKLFGCAGAIVLVRLLADCTWRTRKKLEEKTAAADAVTEGPFIANYSSSYAPSFIKSSDNCDARLLPRQN